MSSLRLSSAASFFGTKPHYSSSPSRPSSSSSLRHPPPPPPPPPHSLSLIRRNPDWRTLASSAQPHPLLSVVSPNKNHNNPLFINTTPNYNKYYKSNFTKHFLGFLLPYFSPRNSVRSSPPPSLPSPSRESTTRSGSGSSHPTSPSSGSGSVMGSENYKGDDWCPNDRGHLKSPTQPPSSSSSSPSMPNHQHHHKKLLTLPTILTLGRVAAVPLLIATFYVDSSLGRTATTGIFIVAAITDWLDGYLARKMRLGTAFGAFLDPVADKLMVAATLILLCSRPFEVGMFGQVPWLLTVPSIAIIGREITMSAVREWAASQNSKLLEAVAVNNLGKWKTAAQMTALTVLLATRDSSLGGPGIFVASGVALLYISAGLSVWSLAIYMTKIWKVLLK